MRRASPAAAESIPAASTTRAPIALGEARRQGGAGADGERHRHEREPGLQGAEAERPLHVEGLEEPEAEDRGVEQEDHEVRGAQVAQAEDAERHQRLARRCVSCLVHAERDEERGAGGERRRARRASPSRAVSVVTIP